MTYVVTDACINCTYTDCVEVCPVECFHEGPNMLVINPETCIDCGVCVPECPAEAIYSDGDENMEKWVEFNRRYAQTWPSILEPKLPPKDADKWKGVPDKLKYLDQG